MPNVALFLLITLSFAAYWGMQSDFSRRGGGHGGPTRHATNATARHGRDHFTAATALRVAAALQLTMRQLRH